MITSEQLTRKFLEKIASGQIKSAQDAVNDYIRTELLEGGILRSQILPCITITNSQLDKDEDPKVNKRFMEVEPNSSASWVPLRGTPDSKIVRGGRVPVYFGRIESEEHIVYLNEIRTYENDIRKILNDKDVKLVQEQEDAAFIGKIDAICDASNGTQHFQLAGGLTKINWVSARQRFPINKPLKFALMNHRTAAEFGKWNYAYDLGPTAAADMDYNGVGDKRQGLKIITTNKDKIVRDNYVYFFSEPQFTGKMFQLGEPKTFIKHEKDWVSFSTYEDIGIGIGNTESFIRCYFKP